MRPEHDADTSVFELAVGEGWDELHPEVRRRYGLTSEDDVVAVADGVMSKLQSGRLATPALYLLARDDFVFPVRETEVGFVAETHALRDHRGEECIYMERRFETTPPRRFVDTVRWNPRSRIAVDLFGRSGRLAAELLMTEAEDDLVITLGRQWFRVAGRYVRLRPPFTVSARLRDGYDYEAGEFEVEARVTSALAGAVYRYDGRFDHSLEDAAAYGASRPPVDALTGVRLPGGASG